VFPQYAIIGSIYSRPTAVATPATFADGTKRKEFSVRITIKEETKEFMAKYLGDLSKAILTVGFASYFFKDLPLFLRFGFESLAVVFLIFSVILIEKKGE
jgi:hypothetical protein